MFFDVLTSVPLIVGAGLAVAFPIGAGFFDHLRRAPLPGAGMVFVLGVESADRAAAAAAVPESLPGDVITEPSYLRGAANSRSDIVWETQVRDRVETLTCDDPRARSVSQRGETFARTQWTRTGSGEPDDLKVERVEAGKRLLLLIAGIDQDD